MKKKSTKNVSQTAKQVYLIKRKYYARLQVQSPYKFNLYTKMKIRLYKAENVAVPSVPVKN